MKHLLIVLLLIISFGVTAQPARRLEKPAADGPIPVGQAAFYGAGTSDRGAYSGERGLPDPLSEGSGGEQAGGADLFYLSGKSVFSGRGGIWTDEVWRG